MNIIDVAFILIILMSGIIGLKRGVIKESVSFLGLFIVVILAFILKNPVSVFLYEHLPFFKFFGIFKGIEVLNILIYEVVAFILVLSILTIILKLVIKLTSVIEKLLTITVILGIPSKILGFIVGIIEGFVWSFIFIYILSLPIFNIPTIKDSNARKSIIKNTPILSKFTQNFIVTIDDFILIKDEYTEKKISSDEFNKNSLDVFLKYGIIDVKSVKILKNKNKLSFNGIDDLIVKYERNENK